MNLQANKKINRSMTFLGNRMEFISRVIYVRIENVNVSASFKINIHI